MPVGVGCPPLADAMCDVMGDTEFNILTPREIRYLHRYCCFSMIHETPQGEVHAKKKSHVRSYLVITYVCCVAYVSSSCPVLVCVWSFAAALLW